MRRFPLKSPIQSIIAPLLVMLMLTVLVGYSAYQMTLRWEQAINSISGSMVRAQILNNIQWQLRQTHTALINGNPEEARHLWGELKARVAFMSANYHTISIPRSLNVFLSDDENLRQIPAILQEDYFRYNLDQMQSHLTELQQNSRNITLIMTSSMALLGLLLMGITAVDLSRLFRELAESRDLGHKIQEEERRRIAQELHDAVIQELIDLKRDYQPAKVDHLVESIRRICHNLKPQILEDLGLMAALELLADDLKHHCGGTVHLNIEETDIARLPREYELPLFRIIQELFNNIRRHAEATQTTLTMVYDPSESPMLRIHLRDNGKGFDPDRPSSHGLGLTGVHQRVLQMGGRFTISSSPGSGATFRILIPVPQSLIATGGKAL